jgi:protoheme IX farnesyltransferase
LGCNDGHSGTQGTDSFLIIFYGRAISELALYRVTTTAKSGLLPVTHGNRFTRLQIFLYTLILFAAAAMPFIFRMSGWLYLVVVV